MTGQLDIGKISHLPFTFAVKSYHEEKKTYLKIIFFVEILTGQPSQYSPEYPS